MPTVQKGTTIDELTEQLKSAVTEFKQGYQPEQAASV